MKIKPQYIAFDIDDVVSDFIPLFLQELKKDSGIDLSLKDVTTFYMYDLIDLPKKQASKILNKVVKNPIELNMQMKPGAKEVIKKLLDKGQVTFVTARRDGRSIAQWIYKQGLSDIVVVAMNSHDKKAGALKRRGIKYFVDDRLETCYQLHKEGIEPIVFNHPHNANDDSFMRVNNWKEISELIDWS